MKELSRTWTSVLTVDLKGSEGQVKEYFIIFCDGFTERDEDHVVDPKQGDQQQSGLGQPPERKRAMKSSRCPDQISALTSLSIS